jgi:hypothetical protein
MHVFVIAAGIMAVIIALAAVRRPHLSLFVAATLWLLYAVWEHLVANGTLCDADCNIRVDLVFIFPILAIATTHAYRSYVKFAPRQG